MLTAATGLDWMIPPDSTIASELSLKHEATRVLVRLAKNISDDGVSLETGNYCTTFRQGRYVGALYMPGVAGGVSR
ncbi:hypothetical protein DVG40_24275 [Salmonella enterica subsp. enterica serovar Inganda]|nr:hypothetical protein [Salmonella enterica subsp. enterica serovar Inganda]